MTLSVLYGLWWCHLFDSLLTIDCDFAKFFWFITASDYFISAFWFVQSVFLSRTLLIHFCLYSPPSCNVSWICDETVSWRKLMTEELDLFSYATNTISFLLLRHRWHFQSGERELRRQYQMKYTSEPSSGIARADHIVAAPDLAWRGVLRGHGKFGTLSWKQQQQYLIFCWRPITLQIFFF